MVLYLLIHGLLGSIILWIRRIFTLVNLGLFTTGCVVGSIGSFFVMAVFAMAHPITSAPGAASLNSMRFNFMGLVFAAGQLGGLLAVNLRLKWFVSRSSAADDTGLSPSDDR